jgi:UTP--glucose-1-phosphate uridylyltransferase
MSDLRYCVIPAAGLGTRFLPATKVLPKELLPVLDRPVIQWGVEEAVEAGATDVVLIISEGKEAIAAHFEEAPLLEAVLRERGKLADLEAVQRSSHLATFHPVYQQEPHGLGHAVLMAKGVVGDQPFMCVLPDDVSHADRSVLSQLRTAWTEFQVPILALARVPREHIGRYGVATVEESRGNLHRVTKVVEKPKPEDAESDLAIMGRYILTGDIFAALEQTAPGAGGEIQLTDGINMLIAHGTVWGVEFSGELLDVGTPQGWLATNVLLAAERDTGAESGEASNMGRHE